MSSFLTENKDDWMPLGSDVFYRRHSLYLMSFSRDFGINLANFKVMPNYYGGSILLTDDPKRSSSISGDVWIFSSSGLFISIVRSIAKNSIHTFLSLTEDIVTVTNDGRVTIYDIFGRFKKDTVLDQNIRSSGIHDCKHYPSSVGTIGLAILTSNHQFYILEDVYSAKVTKLATLLLNNPPSAWCVISSDESATTILVAKNDTPGSVILISQFLSVPVQLEFSSSPSVSSPSFSSYTASASNPGVIHQVTSSVLSNKVALLTDTGLMWIGHLSGNSSLFRLAEYNTKSKIKASQFVWAGDDAVVALWKDLLIAIGSDSSFFNFKVDLPAVLAQEPDGVRIITNNTHGLLQRIPKVVIETKNVGSITAGANLLEAGRQFKAHTQRADIYLRVLKDQKQMEDALSECISSAGHEYMPEDQKALLETAHLGKVFMYLTSSSIYSSTPHINRSQRDEFLNMCKILRVLNTIRISQIGYPMTYEQFEALGLNGLISRLINRKFYGTATSIANFMKVPPLIGSFKILRAWAYEKVTESEFEDDVVAQKIQSKLGPCPGISYSEIANKAISSGRKQLAIRLLEYEVKSSSQAKLLLTLEQYSTAIEKSIISGDQHLLMSILSTIKFKCDSDESFQLILKSNPLALISYKLIVQRQKDFEILRKLLHKEGFFVLEGLQWLEEFYRICDESKETTLLGPTQLMPALESSLKCFSKAKYDFGTRITESQIKLFKFQQRIKTKRTADVIGSSLNDTMKQLILLKAEQLLAELKKEFRVSEKRFWHVKIVTLAETGDWVELRKFCASKKTSPVGYEPFVDACVKFGNRNEALEYARQIIDHESKIRHMVKIGAIEAAAEVAFERADINGLDYVLSRSGPVQRSRIFPLKQQLMSRR